MKKQIKTNIKKMLPLEKKQISVGYMDYQSTDDYAKEVKGSEGKIKELGEKIRATENNLDICLDVNEDLLSNNKDLELNNKDLLAIKNMYREDRNFYALWLTRVLAINLAIIIVVGLTIIL